VINQGDGWQWFLRRLAEFFHCRCRAAWPPTLPAPVFGEECDPPAEIRKHAGTSLEAAALLGRRTGEMHLALASPTDDPAFVAEPFTAEDLAQDAHRIEAQVVSALEALKRKIATLDDAIADKAALVSFAARGTAEQRPCNYKRDRIRATHPHSRRLSPWADASHARAEGGGWEGARRLLCC